VDKKNILLGSSVELVSSGALKSIAQGNYFDKHKSAIRGTGYAVQSLEAALWSFWVTDTFAQALLTAANLGEDVDTTAAICGKIAGADYGEGAIPEPWLEQLVMKEKTGELAEQLGSAGQLNK
jgi:ADP-ribosyl-[dinitrogen reductase] hydrolase